MAGAVGTEGDSQSATAISSNAGKELEPGSGRLVWNRGLPVVPVDSDSESVSVAGDDWLAGCSWQARA